MRSRWLAWRAAADVLPAVLRRLAGESGLSAAIRVLDELPGLLPST
ncbi:hypothetical protein [Nannocystis radixulma]|uniref:Uncharacterized protein n=1 Tax=Nannocystis radixulma TaxID=2995305 RepID=A0ABT5B125_9BACT|nr:hypothetical protein [Nannocystis radixulma]MDC0667390.1 hypothetical protein [Nannocystis radixulma]